MRLVIKKGDREDVFLKETKFNFGKSTVDYMIIGVGILQKTAKSRRFN